MVEDVLVIDGRAETCGQALALTAAALRAGGYVRDSFLRGCLERERDYPTGLPFEIPVAIPHTDAAHVLRAAVCVLRLERPVDFYCMEEPEERVGVEFVFNMALLGHQEQLAMLRAIMAAARDSGFLRRAKALPPEALREALLARWRPEPSNESREGPL